MKRNYLSLILVSLFAVFSLTTACEDPCEAVNCLNGGTCVEGDCNCPEGYGGDNCGTVDLTKIQFLLDQGTSPKALFDAGVPLDELYGKTYAGGLIFFVNTEPANYPFFTGEGLVTTPTDYGNFDEWGCFIETGATGREVGQGKSNTETILAAACGSRPSKSAKICDDLVLEGFDDWWLPSIEEVNLIYNNLHLKGHSNFLGNIRRYQSSTEHDASNFVLRLFWKDTIVNISKISGDDIRPTRSF